MAEALPLFPLGTVLFPGAALPLHVFEPRYCTMVEDLLARPEPRTFAVVAIREGHEVGVDSVRALYDVGCVASLRQVRRLPDGRYALLAHGDRRFTLLALDRSRSYLQADVAFLDEPTGDAADSAAARTREVLTTYLDLLGRPATVELPTDPTRLSYAVAGALAVVLPERQALLEAPDATARLRAEAALLSREIAVMRGLHAAPVAPPPLPPHSLN